MKRQRHDLVLAIALNSRGLAFVVFEGQLAPVDWGIKEVRAQRKNRRCLDLAQALLDRHQPDALVLEDMAREDCRRALRVRDLNAGIAGEAEVRGIALRYISRREVREAFAPLGAITRHAIAEAVAKRLHAFERYLPRPRKPWMSEDARMVLFDAAALALMFFQRTDDGRKAA